MTYTMNPYLSTQNEVLTEIISIIDMYQQKELECQEFEAIIQACMEQYFIYLLKPISDDKFQLNGGAKVKLGKKRMMILSRCLERKNIAKISDLKGVVEFL